MVHRRARSLTVRSGQVVAAVNFAIPWSPEAMIELVSQHGPVLQDTARQIAARVI